MMIFFVIAFVAILYLIATYNRLVSLSQQVKESRSGIATVLKQRFDLIPNLVETVKGYAKHEKELFEKVTKLRTQVQKLDLDKADTKTLSDLAQQSSSLLQRLMVVVENYPDLKASENFKKLQETLEKIEEKLERARRFFNANVREYNKAVLTFPSNLVASMFGFRQEEYFQISKEEKETPKVEF